MDIAPTILDTVGLRSVMDNADGISLLTDKEYEFLMAEDHKDFGAELGQTIEYWAVIDHMGNSILDCHGEWKSSYDLSLENQKKYELAISENMSFYIDNRKITDIYKLYGMTIVPQSHYDSGDKREGILSERKTYTAESKNKRGYDLGSSGVIVGKNHPQPQYLC